MSKADEKGLKSSISFYENREIDRDTWIREVFPTWGTFLNKQIARTQVPKDKVVLWWLGACGFAIKTTEATLLIDNYAGPSLFSEYEYCAVCRATGSETIDWLRLNPQVLDIFNMEELDAHLSTHHHNDHTDFYTIKALTSTTDAKFYAPAYTIKKLKGFGTPEERIVKVKPGDSFKIKDIEIDVLPCYDPSALNSGHTGPVPESFDDCAVSYLFKTGGGNIIHIGDSHFSNMFKAIGEQYEIDVALIPFGNNARGVTDKMSVFDCYRVAENLKAKTLIPMHYDNWAHVQGDPRQLQEIVKENNPSIKTVILQWGGKFEYPTDRDIGMYKYPLIGNPELGKVDWEKSWEYGKCGKKWRLDDF
jgi:L-ascorbate 6-phosphate lactonase